MEKVQVTFPSISTLGRQQNNTNPINEIASTLVFTSIDALLHNLLNSDKSKQK